MAYRRGLIDILSAGPRTASSLARELGLHRQDMEDDLAHMVKSARAVGHLVIVEPARCKACGFVFDTSRLTRPGRCPSCRSTRLYEPLIRVEKRGNPPPDNR